MLRLVDIMKEAKSRVGSFELQLKCFLRNAYRLWDELERVFEYQVYGHPVEGEYVDMSCQTETEIAH